MKNFSAGGIRWECTDVGMWQCELDDGYAFLKRKGNKLWSGEIWDTKNQKWYRSDQQTRGYYETRREAIEGVRCVALFAEGMGCKAISHKLFGLIDAARVEAHLRRWL